MAVQSRRVFDVIKRFAPTTDGVSEWGTGYTKPGFWLISILADHPPYTTSRPNPTFNPFFFFFQSRKASHLVN